MSKLKDFIDFSYIFNFDNAKGVICDDTGYIKYAVYNVSYDIDIPN